MNTKERVQAERGKLIEKIDKLDAFITNDARYRHLSEVQCGLLVAQSQAMNTYSTILELRLENWSD